MQTFVSTTPFGRRPMTLNLMASQSVAKAMPKEAIARGGVDRVLPLDDIAREVMWTQHRR